MKAILLLALSAVILSQSYGFAYADHGGSSHANFDAATTDAIAGPEIGVTTDSSSYETGEIITISGSISDYDASDPFKNFDVTIRLVDPINNIINFSQISPDSDGSYSTFIPAEGPLWKFEGEYTISVSHGSEKSASTTFTFIFSEPEEVIEVIEVSEEELAEKCGSGTHLEDGACILDETTTTTTTSTSGSTGFSGATGPNELVYSITFTVFIAFAIMIILYLISRASRIKATKLSNSG